MGDSTDFEGSTVLLVAAGCAAGAALARGYVHAGARVIAADAAEDRVMRIAGLAPESIDPLKLDVLDPGQRDRFADIWEDEPVHVLVHLQPLRHGEAMGRAMASILYLTEALLPALARGNGRGLVLFETPPERAGLLRAAYEPSLQSLPVLMETRMGTLCGGINGLCLSVSPTRRSEQHLCEAALWLTAHAGAPLRGGVMRLGSD